MFLTNDTAASDLACQTAMAAYAARLQREQQERQAIREGRIQPAQTNNWHISDRD